MKKMTWILGCGVLLSLSVPAAEVVDVNGSFEKIQAMPDVHVKALKEKGFTLSFPKNKWISSWEINPAMNPATVTLINEDAPDGKRFIRICSVKPTHFAQANGLLENRAYTVSFMARGEGVTSDDNLYDPAVKLMAYTYVAKSAPKKWKSSTEFERFDLENKWQEYTVKIPARFPDEDIALVFETVGQIDLDQVKVTVAE